MSIILDALKKMEGEGEKKGSREMAPTPGRAISVRKKGLLFSLAATALALNLFAVVLWLGQREGAEVREVRDGVKLPVEGGLSVAQGEASPLPDLPGVEVPIAFREPAGPVPVSPPVLSPAPAPGGERESAEMGVEETVNLTPVPPAVQAPVAVSPLPPTVQEIASLGERAAAESVNVDEENDGYDGSVLSVDELPGDLRSGVVDLRITAHVYSDDPSFRRVAVNDSLKREGDVVAVDLAVEEITERGAVFRYRGYRFRIDLH